MLSYDIPEETVDAVMSVYYGATAAVKSDGDISDYFDLGVGVLQAPYLFVLISNHLKIRLFNCLVVSILLYNATTWTMNKTLTNALTGGYNRLLRYALNIHWTLGVHQPTNASVFATNHLQPIASILRRRRLTFAGHCYRCFESAAQPIMDVLFFSMKGTRTQGNKSNYRKLLGEETLLDETSLDHWRTITR
jgi:hypothetical protein